MKKQYKIRLPKGMVVKDNAKVEITDDCILVEYELTKEQKYEPKKGDIVTFKNTTGTKIIAIFDCIIRLAAFDGINVHYSFYYAYNTVDCSFMVNPIYSMDLSMKPCDEAEKKLLFDKLASINKKWDADTKQIIDVRWRAKVGERFYFIDDGRINSMIREDFRCYLWKKYDISQEILEDEASFNREYMLWKSGNYFKTHEAVERVIAQIKELLYNSKAE